MKHLLMIFTLFCFNTSFAQKQKTLFNGKNLEKWQQSDCNECFTVANKVLIVKNEAAKKGHILWSVDNYKNFEVTLDFKMISGTVDSGVFLKSELNQIQIGISGSLKRDMTGSPYIPKKSYPVEAKNVANILKLKDWNTLKIKTVGNMYTVWLNGQEVMTYTTESIPETGPIGLQLHPGNEMEIHFKKIKVRDI